MLKKHVINNILSFILFNILCGLHNFDYGAAPSRHTGKQIFQNYWWYAILVLSYCSIKLDYIAYISQFNTKVVANICPKMLYKIKIWALSRPEIEAIRIAPFLLYKVA